MPDSSMAYPLQWPHGLPRTAPAARKAAAFGTTDGSGYGRKPLTIAQARSRVIKQLHLITPTGKPWRVPPDSIVISSNVEVRLDGLPRSNRRPPSDPGVCVYFEIDGEDRCAPCDKWDTVADNLAAIAKTIEADRGKERWGVTSMRDSYQRPALPPPDQAGGESWQDVLGVDADASDDEVVRAYRKLRSAAHEDRGGDVEDFQRVTRAFDQARKERGL